MVAECSNHAQAFLIHPVSYHNHHRNDLTTYFLAAAQDELHSCLSPHGWRHQMSKTSLCYHPELKSTQKQKLLDGPPLLLWKQLM